jgi:hypothetical protein
MSEGHAHISVGIHIQEDTEISTSMLVDSDGRSYVRLHLGESYPTYATVFCYPPDLDRLIDTLITAREELYPW